MKTVFVTVINTSKSVYTLLVRKTALFNKQTFIYLMNNTILKTQENKEEISILSSPKDEHYPITLEQKDFNIENYKNLKPCINLNTFYNRQIQTENVLNGKKKDNRMKITKINHPLWYNITKYIGLLI